LNTVQYYLGFGLSLLLLSILLPLASSTEEETDERDPRKVTDEHTGQVIGLEDYNAQLLEELKNPQTHKTSESVEVAETDITEGLETKVKDYSNEEEEETIIGSSVATSASSAISFLDVTTPQPPAPFKKEEEESSEHLEDVLEGKVDPKDPYLEAVFPHFAQEYQAESSGVESTTDMSDLSFVDDYDFALLNEKGEIEMHGKADELGATINSWKNESEENLETKGNAQKFHEEIDFNDLTQDGPTTLMLFNIFTPDEVDFLSTLVGDDALKEIQKDVDAELSTGKFDNQEGLNVQGSPPLSRRPPQFYDPSNSQDSKNVNPSFPGTGPQASNIRESLQIYDKSEQGQNYSIFLGEEEKKVYSTLNRTGNEDLHETAVVRQQKVEALLNKLSSKYDSNRANLNTSILEGNVEKDDASNNDRMKIMIENLKQKLSTSRPGISQLKLTELGDTPVAAPNNKLFHTTAVPLAVKDVEEILGERLRGLSVGVHRLNLDEMLDMDKIKIEKMNAEEKEKEREKLPETSKNNDTEIEDKSLPKRDVHPKLTFQRPAPDLVHRPSSRLKEYITPGPEFPQHEAVNHKDVPISRYHEQGIPLKDFPKSYQSKIASQVQPPPDSHPQLSDPYPITKELPPYHKPATTYPQPPPLAGTLSTNQDVNLPPPPFYKEPPPLSLNTFRNKIGPYSPPSEREQLPTPQPLHQVHSHGLPSKKDSGTQYVPSSSYRHSSTTTNPIVFESSQHSSTLGPTHSSTSNYERKQPNLRFDSDPSKQSIHVTPKNVPLSATTEVPSYSIQMQTLPDDKIKSLGYRPKSSSLPLRTYSPPTRPTSATPSHVSSLLPTPNRYQASLAPSTIAPPIDYSSPIPKYPSSAQQSSLPYVSSLSLPSNDYRYPKSGKMLDNNYLPPQYNGNILKEESIQPLQQNYIPPVSTPIPPSNNYLPPSYSPNTPEYLSLMEAPNKSYLPPSIYESPDSYLKMQPPTHDYLSPGKTDKDPDKVSHVSSNSPTYVPQYLSNFSNPTYQKPSNSYSQIQSFSHGNSGQADETYSSPPTYESPVLNSDELAHSTMRPPSEDYLVPITSYISAMAPPFKSFFTSMLHQFSKINPPTSDNQYQNVHLTPDADLHFKGLALPVQDYLPPNYPSSSTMAPPQEDYRAPKEIGLPMAPPTNEYNAPQEFAAKMQPPLHSYSAPPSQQNGFSLQPPSQDYLPAQQYSTMSPPQNEYSSANGGVSTNSPNLDYIAPNYDPQSIMKPPSKEYIASNYDMKLRPPNQSYLQPTSSSGQALQPPSSEYIPSKYEMKLEPPNADYLFPTYTGGSTMQPPSQGYVSSKQMSTIEPPVHQYLPPVRSTAIPMHPPSKDYISPVSSYQSTMNPPSSDYTAPQGGFMSTILPPSKEYSMDDYMAKLNPPVSQYLQPKEEKIPMKPPNQEYKAPSVSYMSVPSKEFSMPMPNQMEGPTKNFDPPMNERHQNVFQPPHTAFLAPGQEHFVLREKGEYESESHSSKRISDDFQNSYSEDDTDYKNNNGRDEDILQYDLPNNEYLPPQDAKEKLPKYSSEEILLIDESVLKYHPPKNEYSSPKKESIVALPIHLPTKNYLPPSYDQIDYSPPTNKYTYPPEHEKVIGVNLPNKQYLAPLEKSSGTYYNPPKFGYTNPERKLNVEEMLPPKSEFLPPSNDQSKSSYDLPDKSYFPPSSDVKGLKYRPPQKDFEKPTKLSSGMNYQPPAKEYLPPKEETVGVVLNLPEEEYYESNVSSGVKYLPPKNDYISPKPLTYKPPTSNYVPPHEKKSGSNITPPNKEYDSPDKDSHGDKYQPPSKEYLEPATELLGEKYQPPREEHREGGEKLNPPKAKYLQPQEAARGIKYNPPNKEYLAPKENRRDASYLVPEKEYLPPKEALGGEHYKLPEQEYLPPKEKHQGAIYQVPEKEYLPPREGLGGEHFTLPQQEPLHPKEEHKGSSYQVPEKEYLPPKEGLGGEHYQLPELEYLPAKEDHRDAGYQVPDKEYLPPKESLGGEHYKVPENKYLPPKEYQKDTSYKVPEKEYLPPKEGLGGEHYKLPERDYLPPKEDHQEASYKVPEKEYLPPQEGLGGEHYKLPEKNYLPPKKGPQETVYQVPEKEYLPPKEGLHGEHFRVPEKDYLPPKEDHQEASYQVPEKEYLPPKEGLGGEHYKPPNSEYLPPKEEQTVLTVNADNTAYKLPNLLHPIESQTIIPPNLFPRVDTKMQSYQLPNHDFLPSSPKLIAGNFHPPGKEYLPPPDIPAVSNEHSTKEYLTTTEIAHLHGVNFKPPDTNYLPPPVLPSVIDSMSKLHPPSKSYIPPKETPINEKIPLPNIGLTINGKPEINSHTVEFKESAGNSILHTENGGLNSGMFPQSINIHINMPHTEHEVKESATHHDLHGTHHTSHETHHENHGSLQGTHATHHETHVLSDVPIFNLGYPDKDTLQPHLLDPPKPESLPPTLDPLLVTEHQVIMPHLFRYDSREEFLKNFDTLFNQLPGVSSLETSDKIMPNLFVRQQDKNIPPSYKPNLDDTLKYHTQPHQVNSPMYMPTKQIMPKKEYLPVRHYLPPKEYQPTNLNSYMDPGYDSKLPEYIKLPDQTLIDHESNLSKINGSLDEDFLPAKTLSDVPGVGYLPPVPSNSFLPPSESYQPPADSYLPPPPDPEELEELLNDDFKIPSRGPQFPIKEEFKLNNEYLAPENLKSKYKEPPPRSKNQELEAPSVLNSQGVPPTSFEDKYIPPKTKFDVPKNFKRPGEAIDILEGSDDDLPEPPAPEEIPNIDEDVEQVGELQQISELPEKAFFGLAKLKQAGSSEKENATKQSSKLSKPEKLQLDKGPKLPPIPTLPPQPGKIVPRCYYLTPTCFV